MKKLDTHLNPPWMLYQKKLAALFNTDITIKIGEVARSDTDDFDYIIPIEIFDHKKFVALDRVMPRVVEFGNVKLGLLLFDEENVAETTNDYVEVFKTIFEGNPVVQEIIEDTDPMGNLVAYVRFEPEVLQFNADNLSSREGLCSLLGEDIAKEVFYNVFNGVYFATAPKL